MLPEVLALATVAMAPPAASPAAIPPEDLVRPKKQIVRHTRFRPWAQPTPAQVHTIIEIEAARVGADAAGLARRVACESGFTWNAVNGQYQGLGQFASETFYRGVGSLDVRAVNMTTRRWRAKSVMQRVTLPNGALALRPAGWKNRQEVVNKRRGVLPASPVRTHGWAQIRIMSLALVGRSAVSTGEWECGA